jgi:hypothetical protein
MAVACILISIASFGPSIADQSHRLGGFTILAAAHGILFSAWLLVFLAQTLLVQTGRIKLHRTLGTASMCLAAAMVVLGYTAAIAMTRRGFDLSGDLSLSTDKLGPVNQIIFPLLDILEFGILIIAGYLYRRSPAIHKRLMLFATVAILPAPFAHFLGHMHLKQGLVVPFILASLAASGIYDLIRFRRIHPVSLVLGILLFVIDNLCAIVIGPSAAWHRFATWLIS